MSTPADIARIARQLDSIVKDNRYSTMSRVVLAGEGIMKREVPVRRGTLRRSITSRVERGGNRGIVGTNLNYARPVNDGSRPHIIRPKRAKALKTPYGLYKVVHHPGTKAAHFVERTRDKLRPVAERELSSVYGKALGRVG